MNEADAAELVWRHRRVFVSPALGCPARCTFCYLGDIGAARPRKPTLLGAELHALMVADGRFVSGSAGTAISLGCLSESLAPHSLAATIDFLLAAANTTNPLQLASRWTVPESSRCAFLDAMVASLAVMFHSFSTLSNQSEIERGTPTLAERLPFVRECLAAGIPGVLYIKPFIAGVTSVDVPRFVELARTIGFSCAVIGALYESPRIAGLLNEHPERDAAQLYRLSSFPVSSTSIVEQSTFSVEVEVLVSALTGIGIRVFAHSIEALSFIRSGSGRVTHE